MGAEKEHERIAFGFEVKMLKERVGEILVYGQITGYPAREEDVSALAFDRALKALGDVDALHIRINSAGGNVFEAQAMRAMLMHHPAQKQFFIEGLCASAATLLPTMGVVSMYAGGHLMIHRPMGVAFGHADDMLKRHEMLIKLEGEFCEIYSAHTGRSAKEIKAWMDAETWMTAKEALANGFVDEIIETEDMVAAVDSAVYERMKQMYVRTPEMMVRQVAENEPTEREGAEQMELKDLTMETLMEDRHDLFDAIKAQGAEAERGRIEAIDRTTVKGYESLAFEAKHGKVRMSAGDYALSVLQAQQQKGAAFMEARAEETAAAAAVPGSEAGEKGSAEVSMDALAKEMAGLVDGLNGRAE